MLDDCRALTTTLSRFTARAQSWQTTRESDDRSVTVTVGSQGHLRALTIEPWALARLGPAVLATRIVETAEHAETDAREQIMAGVTALLPPHLARLIAPDGTVETTRLISSEHWSSAGVSR